MRPAFKIGLRYSGGNLHLNPEGPFNGKSAWVLVKTIKSRYRGTGRIFVNTAGLCDIMPSGAHLFKELMMSKNMPLSRLYLKGEKGFEIGPNGSRVLVCNPEKVKRKSLPPFRPVLCAKKRNQAKSKGIKDE